MNASQKILDSIIVRKQKEPKDQDGDGLVFDGTPQERPVNVSVNINAGPQSGDAKDQASSGGKDPKKAESQSPAHVGPTESAIEAKPSSPVGEDGESKEPAKGKDDSQKLLMNAEAEKNPPIERMEVREAVKMMILNYANEKVDETPGEEYHEPDPFLDADGDGITDAARVGVPGMSVPPPPDKIPRLPGLTKDEREVETSFAEDFEKDPDGMARQFRKGMATGEYGTGPNVFEMDKAKALHGCWKNMDMRAVYNTALHNTANAIAKRAFIQHLDEVVMKLPEEERSMFVTMGGVSCHGKNTPVLMHDGSVKMIQDVVIGDLLMGPDSSPRKVLKVHYGQDMLYRVTPKSGDSFVANHSHVLPVVVLRRKGKEGTPNLRHVNSHQQISIGEYFLKSNRFQKDCRLWSTGVSFPEQEVPVDPYYLGIWLGDGTRKTTSITSSDTEIVEFIKEHASGLGLVVRAKKKNEGNKSKDYRTVLSGGKSHGASLDLRNPLRDGLKECEVWERKHIPNVYIANSRKVRLELLAGLLDSDGHYDKKKRSFEIITNREHLANDIQKLVRSLGFSASVKIKEVDSIYSGKREIYFRLHIGGNDLSEIPTKILRKIPSPRPEFQKTGKRSKNNSYTGFHIEILGPGEFFGVELDGDHLYLLADFTVMKNSGKGHSISNNDEIASISNAAAVTWDSAGELNGTELPWLMEEAEKRGIRPKFMYAHADPEVAYDRAVKRAEGKGRMVDAKLFAESYKIGAKNFKEFSKRNSHRADFIVIDNTATDETGKSTPKVIGHVPDAPDPNQLHNSVLHKLAATKTTKAIKRGGSSGIRSWGPPKK